MKEMMKAARLHRIGEKLSIDNVPVPDLGSRDVLVDVKASGICHTDINYREGVSPVGKLPIILGHEIAGVIAEVGDKVEAIEKGDRVCVHYVLSCGECRFCITGRENLCEKYQMIGKHVDGGFAEYIKVPARNVLKLPKAISFEQGAIMGCAVSTAFHALKRGRINVGDTVVIYGVGGVGVHAIQLAAKVFGAGRLIAVDVSEEKLKLAQKLGADEVINAAEEKPLERIKEMTDGRLADVALEFIGLRNTIEEAISCVGKGGRMLVVGICPEDIRVAPHRTIIGKEMEIIGVNDHLKSEMAQLIKLVSSGKINLSDSITHRVQLEEVNRGMEILEKKIGNPVRIVITQ
ncbi:MAG: zinc-binding dehydrogenase [Candidatus Bathyarchaeia archaeon]